MAANPKQDAWVEQVLGVRLRGEMPAEQQAGAPTARLRVLVARIAEVSGGDTSLRGRLAKLAKSGRDALEANDLVTAEKAIGQLRDAIESAAGPKPPVTPIWNEAKETMDGQLNQLYATLKKGALPILDRAAEMIETTVAGYRASLTTALTSYDGAPATDKEPARIQALKVIADYKTRMPADKHVIGAESNPFGVPVTIRATIGAALSQLEERLAP
jgi:hypothetical protein